MDLFTTPELREVFVDQLRRTRSRYAFHLYAWVLMPNHVHLLIREPEAGDVSDLLRSLKGTLARRVMSRWRELDAPVLDQLSDRGGKMWFWQRGGGYDRNIVSDDEFDEKVGYIHMNPVRAGLVEKATDWGWGSARWWGGEQEGEIACDSREN
ncbi:MAG: transposase [Phycisphaerales bacterium]|nr:transposase [Phycisphaerales bacterium]